ncbi:uncharacterized protein DUF664 [Salana multivorans]|uniref:Uncharacterized protein DUF664 n=1 Tax=Salana multivorans TaxID=120377 RepID=A0A3N2D0G8_9MICO|nr:DinB family protein [Salana multivorans]ROR93280.1 uncharacterized protein DUF664 [Salana multivorans]
MTTPLDDQGRPDPEPSADEVRTLTQFLAFQRATLAWKTDGLDDAGLAATLPPSTMTLGGMLGHLAWVEDYWFATVLLGDEPAPRWRGTDWRADPDADWHVGLPGDEVRALWREAVAASDAIVARVLAGPDGLDRLAVVARHDRRVSLRWILVHMIEEYARHNGHADLLREAIDGTTGE